MSLNFNQKLEMMKLSEDSTSESCNRLKARPLASVNQVVNTKEKFLKDIKTATAVNTQMMRNQSSLIAVMEEVLVVWIKG